jgi:DNA-binding MarR family transcriptional regulator
VLAAIFESPGLSQSDLVRATGIDRSTLADMMNRLDKRGLIARTESASDARAYSVRLSASGASILAAAKQHARAADAAILDLLTGPKRRAFLNTLTKLSRLAEQAAERADREAKRQAKREARRRQQSQKKKDKSKPSRKDKPAAKPAQRRHRG